ncbi:MAG: CHY zinc finger protein, partial [Cyclobacteriaceae bacterium]
MKIRGKIIDQETRCVHYHSPNDVIAIKFKCCQQYYPCYQCHEEDVDHSPEVWASSDFDRKAVWC